MLNICKKQFYFSKHCSKPDWCTPSLLLAICQADSIDVWWSWFIKIIKFHQAQATETSDPQGSSLTLLLWIQHHEANLGTCLKCKLSGPSLEEVTLNSCHLGWSAGSLILLFDCGINAVVLILHTAQSHSVPQIFL